MFLRTWRENSLPLSHPYFLECLSSATLDLLKGNNNSLVHKCLAYKHGPVAEGRVHFVLRSSCGNVMESVSLLSLLELCGTLYRRTVSELCRYVMIK